MAELANITPSPAQASDLFLVRRGAEAPFDLDLLSDLTPATRVALVAETTARRNLRKQYSKWRQIGEKGDTIACFRVVKLTTC